MPQQVNETDERQCSQIEFLDIRRSTERNGLLEIQVNIAGQPQTFSLSPDDPQALSLLTNLAVVDELSGIQKVLLRLLRHFYSSS